MMDEFQCFFDDCKRTVDGYCQCNNRITFFCQKHTQNHLYNEDGEHIVRALFIKFN